MADPQDIFQFWLQNVVWLLRVNVGDPLTTSKGDHLFCPWRGQNLKKGT
jgi:hypothetical protein